MGYSRILRKRDEGAVDDGNDYSVRTEVRRRLDDEAVSAAQQPVVAASLQPASTAASPNNPPIIAPGPDRLHKDAPSYVVVSHDHPPGEDPVLNPGYAVVGHASSIASGMAQAVAHQQRSGGRVVLWIWGGQWKEDLTVLTSGIDVLGADMPVVVGHSIVGTGVIQTRIEGLNFTSIDTLPALIVQNAPPDMAPESLTEFYGCQLYAPATAFLSQRRVYMERCSFVQTAQQVVTDEIACAIFEIAPSDIGPSHLKQCQIQAFKSLDPVSRSQMYSGFAIKGTAKNLSPLVNGGYFRGRNILLDGVSFIPNEFPSADTGLLLDHCDVYGCVLNEGWNIFQRHGTGHSGYPAPDRRGGVYCMNRGWYMIGTDGDAIGAIPAWTFLDHVNVHSAYVARFVADPAQTPPYSWGGSVWCRYVNHLAKYDGAGSSPFILASGVGKVYVTNSVTAATTWLNTGLATNVVVDSYDATRMFSDYGLSATQAALQMLDWYMI